MHYGSSFIALSMLATNASYKTLSSISADCSFWNSSVFSWIVFILHRLIFDFNVGIFDVGYIIYIAFLYFEKF